MRVTDYRTKKIINYLSDKHGLEYCDQYGERGYQDPEVGILFCNWNPISRGIQQYLEEAGYSLEWSDEWYIDYDNNKAWRTNPDSYGWVCAIRFTDFGVLTPDDSIEDWIDECSVTDYNQPHPALPDWITHDDLIERGFTKHNGRFETGFHPGQNDKPRNVSKKLFEEIEDIESVVFRVESSGQFDINWEAWYRLHSHDDEGGDTDDAYALASAGFGTDEDYGGCCDN